MLEVCILDLWLCACPKLQVEGNGAICGGVYDSRLARVWNAFTHEKDGCDVTDDDLLRGSKVQADELKENLETC